MTPQPRSTRYSWRLPVSLGSRLSAQTVNVSATGLRIDFPHVFLPGSIIDGVVRHQDVEIAFRGEVAWARPGNLDEAIDSTMGIRFLQVDEALQQLLKPS